MDLTEFMKQRNEPSQFESRRFGGECSCRLPAWTSSMNQENVSEEHKVCDQCRKQQIIYKHAATFGTGVEDVVNEIRFRVEQVTDGLTCSAGRQPIYNS